MDISTLVKALSSLTKASTWQAEWVHNLWIWPITLLLTLWAAFIVLGIKGLMFHRQPGHRPRPSIPAELFDTETGEVIRTDSMGLGCALCLYFITWPLVLASRIDDWLPPPKNRS